MYAFLTVLALAAVAAVWLYNRLVRDRNQVLAAWSDIDVQLLRRHDLVPQLVTAVKAYADYEQATMAAITELRTRSEAAKHLPDKAAIEAELAAGVNRLLVVAEAYPDLKASANFLQLQKELVAIEDHIQYARRFYNGAVRILNTRIQSFPHLLLAGPLGFRAAEYFEVEDAQQRAAVRVELNP
jgi:LemA protein